MLGAGGGGGGGGGEEEYDDDEYFPTNNPRGANKQFSNSNLLRSWQRPCIQQLTRFETPCVLSGFFLFDFRSVPRFGLAPSFTHRVFWE
jgi:hypothetical protein